MTAKQFLARVDRFMVKRYGITWADSGGDIEAIERAAKDGEQPEEWAEAMAIKYDLDPIGPW